MIARTAPAAAPASTFDAALPIGERTAFRTVLAVVRVARFAVVRAVFFVVPPAFARGFDFFVDVLVAMSSPFDGRRGSGPAPSSRVVGARAAPRRATAATRVARAFLAGASPAAGEVFKTLETTDLRIYKSVSSGSERPHLTPAPSP
jgi:hypothetical protein